MQLLPNQSVELHVKSGGGFEIYRTRVEDSYDDLVIVGAPIKMGTLVPLRIGTRLEIQFKRQEGLLTGRYTNQAIIEKRSGSNIPVIQLKLLGTWEKTQERDFLRVPVSIDTVFQLYSEGGLTEPPQSGLMRDLSGGGFLLSSSHPFKLDDKIRTTFALKDESIAAEAIVVRLVPTDSRIDYGFVFVDLPERVRQLIIKFAFQRQIALAELMRNDQD